MQITIDNLDVFKRFGAKIYNEFEFVKIRNIASIENATENSLIFIDTNAVNKKTITSNTKANVVICDFETYKEFKTLSNCFIVTDNPKLLFARSVAYIVENTNPLDRGIHPTATIHQNAKIDDNVFIGANCTIGDCEIGENTIIHSGCNIYDGVTIGKNVMIDSGTVIGSPGFGFVRDENGVPYRFPQLGKVIIHDYVEIGANTCIDRGSLGNTIIQKGVKISNLVQIAHNVEIGMYSYIIAHTIIAGGAKIGDKCWIASSYIMNKVKIGNNVTVGFGAVVLNSVDDNETVIGYPAISIDDYKKQKTIRKKRE